MSELLNKYLFGLVSKKLFAFIVVTAVTVYAVLNDSSVPAEFYWFAASYVGSQGFVDGFAKLKGS